MLTEAQANRVWQRMAEAEVRSLYFGDLAARYTKRKQIIAGISFFLASGAAASLWAKTPGWVPLVMAVTVAVLTAYSIAVNLDKKAITMAKLQSDWSRLAADYERLWHHWFDEDAEEVLEDLLRRGRNASEMGSTEAPFDARLIDKWQEYVYSRYSPTPA